MNIITGALCLRARIEVDAMKYLRKEFATLKQAENYLIKLYDKYIHVQLISFPRFSERGTYIFEISRESGNNK